MGRKIILFMLKWWAGGVDRLSFFAVGAAARLSARFRAWRRLPQYGDRLGDRLDRIYAAAPFLPRGLTLPLERQYGSGPLEKSVPTTPLELPRDLAAHDWTKMEWWYYTGHLTSSNGRHFGFEITFFTYRLSAEDGFPLENNLAKEIPVKAVMGHFWLRLVAKNKKSDLAS
jgi:hypothetical protein